MVARNMNFLPEDERSAVVLYERMLREALAKTLKAEAPKIKQEAMREMAKYSGLDIIPWSRQAAKPSHEGSDKLLNAYQTIYMTSRFDRLKYNLVFKWKKFWGMYNIFSEKAIDYSYAVGEVEDHKLTLKEGVRTIALKKEQGHIIFKQGNPYTYLKEADIGYLHALWKFGFSYLKNQDKLDEQFKFMREDYINQLRHDYADFISAAKKRMNALFVKKGEVLEASTTQRTLTSIETCREKIKDAVEENHKVAQTRLADELDDIVLGSDSSHFFLSYKEKQDIYTSMLKNVLEEMDARKGSGTKFLSAGFNEQFRRLKIQDPNVKKTPLEKALLQKKLAKYEALSERFKALCFNPGSHTAVQNTLRDYFTVLADIYVEMYATPDFYKKGNDGKSKADVFVEEHNALYVQAVMLYHHQLLHFARKNKTPLFNKMEALYNQNTMAVEINAEYERLEAETDLVMAKKRQAYFQKGFTLAKRFAIGCGFFSAGGWALFSVGFVPGWVAGLALVPFLYFAFHAMRMNWLSSNDEMGDPNFNAEVDRGDLRTPMQKRMDTMKVLFGLKGFAAWKYYMFTPQSEYSLKGAKRAAQHAANETTGVVWGLLTAIGLLGIGYSLPAIFYPSLFNWGSAFMVNMGFLGAMNIVAFTGLGALGLALGYVTYKVFGLLIRLKSDKNMSQGKDLYDNYYKELFLVSEINNKQRPTSTHYVKQTATLFGILLTAMSSITLLSDIVAMATGAKLGLGFMGIDAAIAVSTLLAFSIIVVAFIGLKDFYIQRSQNSVLKGQADTFGGNLPSFDDDKLGSLGIDASAPDIAAQVAKANPDRPWWKSVSELFFSTADNVDSEQSRRVNALSQAGPAIGGGIAFMLMTVSAGLRALGVISPIAAGVGIGIGILGGICAAVGSYQANGIGNRKIKHNITDDKLLSVEVEVLNSNSLQARMDRESVPANANRYKAEIDVAGALKALTDFAHSTERKAAAYHGFGYARHVVTNKARVETARFIVEFYRKNNCVPKYSDFRDHDVAKYAIEEPASPLNRLHNNLHEAHRASSAAFTASQPKVIHQQF